MNDQALKGAITAERRELAALLRGLPDESWREPSLCQGWTVREVVAHLTMPFRYSLPQVILGVLRARGSFDRMADRAAKTDAATLSTDELVASIEDNAERMWKPPGGGLVGALSHDVIHGLDITVALGSDRRVPADRLRAVLGGTKLRNSRRFFGVDLDGVRLAANDLDWSIGEGVPLRGSAQDLLLVLCGRTLPAGRLEGEQAARFTQALSR